MDDLQRVDELYTAFWRTLPGMLHAEAQGLAHTLKLAPSRDVPWSEVFSNAFTLAAPALLAEAMPGVAGSVVQDALLAHMLAVIEAFGTDRIQDGQVPATWQLETVLAHVRRARDEAIRRVAPGVDDPAIDFARADEETLEAIGTERRLLRAGQPADFDQYHAVSIGKQRVGFPASIALAHAARWSSARRTSLSRLLAAVWIGLQLQDDATDWEDDFLRGGAWAVALASEHLAWAAEVAGAPADDGAPSATVERLRASSTRRPASTPPWGLLLAPAAFSEPLRSAEPPALASVRRAIFRSGVIASMLRGAARCYRGARRRAAALGARRVATWAQEREGHAAELARCEAESPGYARRAHALAAWARAVLS